MASKRAMRPHTAGNRRSDSVGYCQLYLVRYPWTAHKDRYCFLIIPDHHDQTAGTIVYPERYASDVASGVKYDKFRAVSTQDWTREEMAHESPYNASALRRAILEIPVQGLQENAGASWALDTLRAIGSDSLNTHTGDSLVARCVHDSGLHEPLMAAWIEALDETRVEADAEGTRGSGARPRSGVFEPQGRFLETDWPAEHLYGFDVEREPKRVRIISKHETIGMISAVEPETRGRHDTMAGPMERTASSTSTSSKKLRAVVSPDPMSRTMSNGSTSSNKLRKRSRSRSRPRS